jgi:hypothetical protein
MPDYSKLEALAALMGPEPVCLNCGRCVLVGKCCDKYTPMVDYDLWEKERSKVRALEQQVRDLTICKVCGDTLIWSICRSNHPKGG